MTIIITQQPRSRFAKWLVKKNLLKPITIKLFGMPDTIDMKCMQLYSNQELFLSTTVAFEYDKYIYANPLAFKSYPDPKIKMLS